LDAVAEKAREKERKKKEKARKEWFSFIGRIVAQVVGAVASVVLAIFFVQRSQSAPAPATMATEAGVTSDVARTTRRSGDERITLAVLPLANYSGDPQQEYFAAGMTDALIADLAQIQGLRVISRTSVMQYRTQPKSIPEIATELGVDLVVEGSVARAGDRVRVTAQLIDTATDEHLWARNYERTMKDVLALQGELVAEIAKEVKVAVAPIRRGWLIDRPTVDPVAYDLYLRGRHAWGLRGAEAMAAATSYFQQAIDRQPNFALAYAGLADAYLLWATTPAGAPTARERALAAATRALELDPSLAEAHTSRAGVHFFHERNLAAAERGFLRALEFNPGYPIAHQWYAILLSELGRDSEALSHAREAVALDPLSGTMHQALGLVHYYGRRYDDAVSELRKALDLSSRLPLPRAVLAKALFQQGEYDEVVKLGESTPEPRTADLVAITGLAYQRLSQTARADEVLLQLRRRKPLPLVQLAYWYAMNGRPDEAFEALKQRTDPGAVPAALNVDPLFDTLRDDARFKALTQSGTP
jgi:TolB-like protein/Flp pilus assembly protein TadD